MLAHTLWPFVTLVSWFDIRLLGCCCFTSNTSGVYIPPVAPCLKEMSSSPSACSTSKTVFDDTHLNTVFWESSGSWCWQRAFSRCCFCLLPNDWKVHWGVFCWRPKTCSSYRFQESCRMIFLSDGSKGKSEAQKWMAFKWNRAGCFRKRIWLDFFCSLLAGVLMLYQRCIVQIIMSITNYCYAFLLVMLTSHLSSVKRGLQ